MKKIHKLLSLIFVTCILLSISACSIESPSNQNDSSIPTPTKNFYVNDFANILSDNTENEIFTVGKELYKQKGIQFVLVTVKDLNGQSIEDYSNKLFNKWGIGDKKTDKGLLLILSVNNRRDRLEVGSGLEADLQDRTCDKLLDTGKPELGKNNFEKGLITIYSNTLTKIGFNLDSYPELKQAKTPVNTDNSDDVGFIIFLVVVIFIIIVIIVVAIESNSYDGFGGSSGGFFGGGGFFDGGDSDSFGGGGGFSAGGGCSGSF
jgi:uncharacterized protein